MVAEVDGTPVSFMLRPFRTRYSQKRKNDIIRGWFGRGGNQNKTRLCRALNHVCPNHNQYL